MYFAMSLLVVAGFVQTQNLTGHGSSTPVQLSSVLEVLGTALPPSLLTKALTNPIAAASDIVSSLAAGETPDWFSSLPIDVKTFLFPTPLPNNNIITTPYTVTSTTLGTAEDSPVIGPSKPVNNSLTQLINSSTSSTGATSSVIFSDRPEMISSNQNHEVSLSGGAIGGIVVGAVAVLIMAATSCAWFLFQRRKQLADVASPKVEQSSGFTATPQSRPGEMLDSNDIVEIDSIERMPESGGTRHLPPEMLAPGRGGEELSNSTARSELDGTSLSVRHEMKA